MKDFAFELSMDGDPPQAPDRRQNSEINFRRSKKSLQIDKFSRGHNDRIHEAAVPAAVVGSRRLLLLLANRISFRRRPTRAHEQGKHYAFMCSSRRCALVVRMKTRPTARKTLDAKATAKEIFLLFF